MDAIDPRSLAPQREAVTERNPRTITLRARWSDVVPAVGTLLMAPKGSTVYRVLEDWRVSKAGDRRIGFRLVCTRLSPPEVPKDAEVLPWPRDPRAPRGDRRTGHRLRQSVDPVSPEANRQSRVDARAEQLARARRVGRDAGLVKYSDYGPGVRLEPVRAHDGAMLREADVVVGDAPDPHAPKRTIRRARRTDHLLVLLREGTIDRRQADAWELLRNAMERSQRSMPAMPLSEGHVAPWDRTAISEQQLKAGCHVRRALAALDDVVRPAVLCIVRDGGAIRDYAAFAHLRHTTAAELLRRGLGALADHYRLAVSTPA